MRNRFDEEMILTAEYDTELAHIKVYRPNISKEESLKRLRKATNDFLVAVERERMERKRKNGEEHS